MLADKSGPNQTSLLGQSLYGTFWAFDRPEEDGDLAPVVQSYLPKNFLVYIWCILKDSDNFGQEGLFQKILLAQAKRPEQIVEVRDRLQIGGRGMAVYP